MKLEVKLDVCNPHFQNTWTWVTSSSSTSSRSLLAALNCLHFFRILFHPFFFFICLEVIWKIYLKLHYYCFKMCKFTIVLPVLCNLILQICFQSFIYFLFLLQFLSGFYYSLSIPLPHKYHAYNTCMHNFVFFFKLSGGRKTQIAQNMLSF